MNRLILAVALTGVLGVAHAEGEITSYSKNYFDISAGVTSSKTTVKDEDGTSNLSGTGYNLGVAYTSYQNQHLFLQPSLQYITTGNEAGDKYVLGKLNVGYTFDLQNKYVKSISPKVGVGVYRVGYDGGSNYGIGYSAGLEVGVTEKVSVEVGYNYLKGKNSGNHVDLTTVALKYKF